MIEYRYVDTRTEKWLFKAEMLKREGLELGPAGFWSLQFHRSKETQGYTELAMEGLTE